MAFDVIGRAQDSGRDVFVAEAARIEELPMLLSLPCPRFVLLLAYADTYTPARLSEALGQLLERGCVYLCTWGPGCEHVHDTMDTIVLERELDGAPQQTIMTTWHDDTLEEAVDFALRHALPDDALLEGCDAIVLAAVGNVNSGQSLARAAQPYLAPVL